MVANNLDYTNNIPSDFLVNEQFTKDLPDRNLIREAGRFSGIVFSPNDPQLADNLDLRRSISMAIDRELIIDQIFNGVYKPANGWAPSVVSGATDTACGDNCKFDPEAAKALYEQAGVADRVWPIAFDCVKVFVVRDASAVLFSEFGQKPMAARSAATLRPGTPQLA